jgi:predicted RNA binding protein YcfA (HicA-like mRNA interferase family)
MKVREVITLLERDGWDRVKSKSGHRQYKHPTKPGRVTVSGKGSHDLPEGTLKSIFRQAGWQQ